MRKSFILAAAAIAVAACAPKEDAALRAKVDEYAIVEMTSPLLEQLTPQEREIVDLLRLAAVECDNLFWLQTYGDKAEMEALQDPAARDFAMLHYGPWDRLDDNKPFIEGVGAKPLGCNYYPQDITAEEFAAFDDPDKLSLYTVVRRNEDGSLKTVWYRDEYKEHLDKIIGYMEQAIALSDNEGFKTYLAERIKAFRTDDYLASDLAWMDMKDSRIDFVVGPIENYDDKFNEAKASYEAFILLKDEKRSADLEKFVSMLPYLQTQLPCDPKYKTFVPGTSSDLNVYDAIFYAGDCNAGSKTIAINLPNDERVHAAKGARRLQLKNRWTRSSTRS